MDTRVVRTSRTVLMVGGLVLVAAACGSDGQGSTTARPAHPSTPGGGGAAIVSTASVGGSSRLVSADGHTLYVTRGESPDHFLCVGPCTRAWRPVLASRQQAQRAASALGQQLAAVGRPGGETQLAYAGHPLYVFVQEGPHQLRGDGVADEFHGTHLEWSAVTPGTPRSPGTRPTMGSKPSDMGGGYAY